MKLTKKQFKDLEKNLEILTKEVRASLKKRELTASHYEQLLDAQSVINYYAYQLGYKF